MEDDRMNSENQRLTEELAAQIVQLKSLAFDIEEEAKEHNKYLDGMGWDMDSARNLVGGGVNRVNKLLGSGRSNRRLMCYVIAGVLMFGLILFHLAGRATSHVSATD